MHPFFRGVIIATALCACFIGIQNITGIEFSISSQGVKVVQCHQGIKAVNTKDGWMTVPDADGREIPCSG